MLGFPLSNWWCRATDAVVVGTALSFVFAAQCSAQETYPSRSIRLVVPFGAGSPIDIVARLLADKIGPSLKQSLVIENRPGAGGNLGTEAVARAAPDGYTLGLVLDTVLTANQSLYKRMSFDPEKDLRPIAIVATTGQMLVVHPSVPVRTVKELVDHAKSAAARKEPLIYGSGGGNGTPGHLTMESFRQRAGFEATHLPYRGNPAMVMGLVTGEIKLGFVTSAGMMDHVQSGKLKALAVSQASRSAAVPEVPTLAEAGFAGFSVGFSQVLIAPSALLQFIASRLESEVSTAMKEPDIVGRLQAMDAAATAITGDRLMEHLRQIRNGWSKVVADGQLRAE
jgi:tripartite-type tricarboxylate transporter receptor subunit TctC